MPIREVDYTMKEALLLLGLFAVYAVVLIIRAKDKKIRYAKVVAVTIVTAVLSYGLDRISKLIAQNAGNATTSVILDTVRWIMISVILIWSCYRIFKLVTKNQQPLLSIATKNFRVWTYVACAISIVGAIVVISGNVFLIRSMVYMESVSPVMESTEMIELMGQYTNVVKGFSLTRRILVFLTPISIMIPTILYKEETKKKSKKRR
ncbi:MAG TPA: hypothetical protein PLZ77_01105 [Lachnospiraceae bacterium]|nr:hypothetical protein [Lachnospiraceae bacterium]